MKKLSLYVCLCLLLSAAVPPAYAEARNAFEFFDIFYYRLDILADILSTDACTISPDKRRYEIYEHYNALVASDNEYSISTPFGVFVVSVPDFTITSFNGRVIDLLADEEQSDIDSYRAAMVYSALEHDLQGEYYYSVMKKINKGLPETYTEYIGNEFFNRLIAICKDETLINQLYAYTGSKVPFASGNYDYTLMFLDDQYNGKQMKAVYLIATKK